MAAITASPSPASVTSTAQLAVIDAAAYADLATADAAAAAAGKVLTIGTAWNSVPSTLSASIRILPGGQLNGSGSVAITGDFEGTDNCFGLNQTVTGLKVASPEWWGVTGKNDQLAIQKANDAVDNVTPSRAGSVVFKSGSTYAITGQLLIGNAKWQGSNTHLYINDSANFSVNETAGNPHSTRPGIKTKSSRGNSYSSAWTTQQVNIDGIDFYMNFQGGSSVVAESLLLENVNGGSITNSGHKATDKQIGHPHNSFDFYANVNNVSVTNSTFETLSNPNNEMGAQHQGGFWLRNSGPASVGATTGNIVVDHCTFRTNQWDEALAIFTAESEINNVSVTNCNFYYTDSTEHPVMLAAYGTGTAGMVKNVTVDRCNFTGSSTALVRQGIKARANHSINVNVTNSNFDLYSNKNSATQGVTGFVIQNVNTVSNCKINILGDDASKNQLIQAVKNCNKVTDTSVTFSSALHALLTMQQAFVENALVQQCASNVATVN